MLFVAPLMRMARLHMAPPRPLCRGLDEKAGGAGVLAALWRTSQGVQKPQPACWGKRFLTGSQEQVVAPSAGPGSGPSRRDGGATQAAPGWMAVPPVWEVKVLQVPPLWDVKVQLVPPLWEVKVQQVPPLWEVKVLQVPPLWEVKVQPVPPLWEVKVKQVPPPWEVKL